MPSQSDISVFDYTDYRRYLLDYYKEQKKNNKAFSYRFFMQRVGLNSSGFYKELVEGKRQLSRSLILRFSEVLKHTKREAEYFENMVYFNDAKTVDERKLYFERMMACCATKAQKVEPHQYEFYSKWYYSAIREVMSFFRFKDDYPLLAKTLNPPIRPEQAKKAIQLMEKLGLIRKAKDGCFERVDQVITSGPQVQSLNIVNFQKAMNRIADEAYDRHKPKQCDMSTLTLSISEETFKKIKEEVTAMRRKILAMAEKDEKPDRVYQLNHHLFPLSKI